MEGVALNTAMCRELEVLEDGRAKRRRA